jgi:hypothetical protein
MIEFAIDGRRKRRPLMFVELPSANRKAAAVTRRLFVFAETEKRTQDPPLVRKSRSVLRPWRQRRTPKVCNIPNVSKHTISAVATIV